MLEHVWVYQYTEHGEIGHCSRCGISDESPSQVCISEAEAKLRRLPADWEKDSSLETWFPLTAERLKRLEGEALNLRRKIHNLERHNQHFERCESSWCNPSTDPTELSKIPQGDLAKLETIKQLEAENAKLTEKLAALNVKYETVLNDRNALLDRLDAGPLSSNEWQIRAIRTEKENAELRTKCISLECRPTSVLESLVAELRKEFEELKEDRARILRHCKSAHETVYSQETPAAKLTLIEIGLEYALRTKQHEHAWEAPAED